MRRRLPPLNALRVFEVAGQLKNFSQAADKMCITQSAVSKQVKLLEEHLDTRLFYRKDRGVQLTDSGERLLDVVSQSLSALEQGVHEFYTVKNTQTLNVNITPSLSNHWLLQRVHSFQQRFPDILLNIDSDEREINWEQLVTTDLAVRILSREDAPNDAELIVAESLVLVAAPSVLQQRPIQSVSDIQQHNLIINSSREGLWEQFFTEFDIEEQDVMKPLSCQHAHMTIDAAMEGFGLALAPRMLCDHLLADGQLVNPLGIEMDSGHGCYFLTPPYKRNARNVQIFSQWLNGQLVPVGDCLAVMA